MTSSVITTNQGPAASETFSAEQKEYLAGFMEGVAKSGLIPFVGQLPDGRFSHQADGTMTNQAAESRVFNTPVSDLCKEELWKHQENPLDSFDRLVTHAESNQLPDPENTFRFKFFGLFHVSPAQKSFMLRCRIPAGILTATQMRGLAEIAADWGGGYADITTRANLQIREIEPRNVLQVLGKLQDLGLTSRGSGADNIRNITCSPTSGIDLAEICDCRPYAKALHHYILNQRDLYGLPRKFNVSFDGGGAISTAADTNDIGFIAVKVSKAAGEPHGIGEGVYFRAQLAGITGHQQFAMDSGILIAPREVVAVAAAMIRVFSENGDRTNRKKARLKYLLDKWGFEKFVEETGKKLAFPIRHFPLELCEPRHPPIKHSHLGVYRQFQTGMNYVGPAIPVGRMKAWQMHRLAEIAERYGAGELRLTVFQNLILPNVADTAVENVKRALVRLGFEPRASAIAGGLVACTGSKGCKYAATNTKEDAIALVRALENKLQLDFPINIHFTGCPHSCAQHYMGDIGLIGTKVGANSEEGYHVVLGGGFDHEQGVGREVFKGISVNELPVLLEKILTRYQAARKSGETFVEFTRRHEIGQLQEIFS